MEGPLSAVGSLFGISDREASISVSALQACLVTQERSCKNGFASFVINSRNRKRLALLFVPKPKILRLSRLNLGTKMDQNFLAFFIY